MSAVRQIYEYHPSIGLRFVPDLKARVPHECGGYLVRTNQTGFRSNYEFVPERNGDKRRVLLFGDSFTAGEGVSNGQRYSDFLEKQLPELEVYNFGLPATGLDQHYLIYQSYAQGIEHDLLVIAVFVENVRRVGSRFRHFINDTGERVLYGKPYYTLDQGQLVLHGVPPPKLPVDEAHLSNEDRQYVFTRERFPTLKRRFNQLKQHPQFERWLLASGLKDRVMKLLRYQPIKEYDQPDSPAWLVMRALIGRWIREHPKPVLLVPIPLHLHAYGISSARAYQERLSEATHEAGGHFFDPLPALMQAPLEIRKTFYFAGDHHLTKTGHEALAHAMAPSVSALLPNSIAR
ncbi:MAG: SGNH/GDSL hydrolase family protein [Burkholderiales bacterium]